MQQRPNCAAVSRGRTAYGPDGTTATNVRPGSLDSEFNGLYLKLFFLLHEHCSQYINLCSHFLQIVRSCGPEGKLALIEVRVLAGFSRTGSRLSVTRAGGVCPNRAPWRRGPSFQCRSCADFKVAVTIVHLAEAERTWVMMQGESPQAGNRARKSFRRHQWSDHAGELGLGLPGYHFARDGHAKTFCIHGYGPHEGSSPSGCFK